MISSITIPISRCITGIYLRWWFNGYHYFNFTNGYEITMSTESMGTQVTKMFSRISKVERPTKLKAEYSYQIILEGITAGNIPGFEGLLLAEKVEQYESGVWREVEITRGEHITKDENAPGYIFNFEITRKELPNTPAVFQKSQHLYINDTECDLDEDEIIPVNKQVNDIAEMQDRQSDFTAQFKIRKTRAMRALFELSGEAGANTSFPYIQQSCRYVSNGIEMITGGYMILDKGDNQYYYASIYSGNLNFFKQIELLKLTDLSLTSTNHTWNLTDMNLSHTSDLDYLYPLCEPSDDGGMTPLKLVGNTVELFGGWIWPFVKIKAIWDEIFSTAKFTPEGDILTNDTFLKLFMPIVNLTPPNISVVQYLYSLAWYGRTNYTLAFNRFAGGNTLIVGSQQWLITGYYKVPYTALYKFRVGINIAYDDGNPAPTIHVYEGQPGASVAILSLVGTWGFGGMFTGEYTAVAGVYLSFWATPFNNCTGYSLAITEIVISTSAFSIPVTPHINLPDLTQIEFVKLICNMFALIPDVTARDKKIKFWNYSDLYNNIPIARDWSAYLSEQDDETEFKFGDYAQRNYIKYKESEDVILGNGDAIIEIDDKTLPTEKDVVQFPVSFCDEITIDFTAPTVNVSRIAFNSWDNVSDWKANKSIDARIVYVKTATGKTFKIWDTVAMNAGDTIVTDPKVASSLEISSSYIVTNYAGLSRLLTKTNLRRAKFNLPVYEVAGLKHYIPIYLGQYKAYFYVNKINNYVPGQLCTIDLIKL